MMAVPREPAKKPAILLQTEPRTRFTAGHSVANVARHDTTPFSNIELREMLAVFRKRSWLFWVSGMEVVDCL